MASMSKVDDDRIVVNGRAGDTVAELRARVAELERELAEWRGLHVSVIAGNHWPSPYSQDVAMAAWAIEHAHRQRDEARRLASELRALMSELRALMIDAGVPVGWSVKPLPWESGDDEAFCDAVVDAARGGGGKGGDDDSRDPADPRETCGCGRPVRYELPDGDFACNKHMRCPQKLGQESGE